MQCETLYFTEEVVDANRLQGQHLRTSTYVRSDDHGTLTYENLGEDYSAKLGIRVWKRHPNGVETEITSRTPVAIVEIPWNRPRAEYSVTWTPPETKLTPPDSIVIRFYCKLASEETWHLLPEPTEIYPPTIPQANQTTQRLNATKLNAVAWTIRYYADFYYDFNLYYDTMFPTRIENFCYEKKEKGIVSSSLFPLASCRAHKSKCNS